MDKMFSGDLVGLAQVESPALKQSGFHFPAVLYIQYCVHKFGQRRGLRPNADLQRLMLLDRHDKA